MIVELGHYALVLAFAGLLLSGWLAYEYADLLFDPLYPALGLIFLVGAATFYVYRRVELQRGESVLRAARPPLRAPLLVP